MELTKFKSPIFEGFDIKTGNCIMDSTKFNKIFNDYIQQHLDSLLINNRKTPIDETGVLDIFEQLKLSIQSIKSGKSLIFIDSSTNKITVEIKTIAQLVTLINEFELSTKLISNLKEDLFKFIDEQTIKKSPLLINETIIGAWELFVEDKTVYFNDEYIKMLGYDKNQLNGLIKDSTQKYVHPEDLDRLLHSLKSYINLPKNHFFIKFRMLHKFGHYLWIQATANATKLDQNGHALRLLGSVMDVSHRIKMESELRQTNTSIFAENPHMNALFDTQGNLIDCNLATLEFFGYKDKLFLKRDFNRIFPPFLPKVQPNGRKSRSASEIFNETMKKGVLDFQVCWNVYNKPRYYQIHSKQIVYNETLAIVIYAFDVTDRVVAQTTLEKGERILKIINAMTTESVASKPEEFVDVVENALGRIGNEMNVDRVRIWVNEDHMEKELFRWLKPETSSVERTKKRAITELPFKYKLLSSEKTLNGPIELFPTDLKKSLEIQQVKSALFIPIFIQGNYWGFITFEDLKANRIFSKEEEEVLRSGGNIIATSYIKNEITKNLIEAREAALSSVKAKSEFLSRMSHEIRTPMNAIIGMTAVARGAKNLEDTQKYLDQIVTATNQLLGIVNDILDMSKIDSGKLKIQNDEFDFEKMLQNLFNIIQVNIQEKSINFTYDIDFSFYHYVVSDELRILQILTNLLSNAIKFTEKYGEINLKIRKQDITNNEIKFILEVTDNGIGIEQERIEKVFDFFEQADNSITRKYGGTGLGLAICKQLATLLDGEIWLESTHGEGSSFFVEFPVRRGSPLKEYKGVSIKHLNILMIDNQKHLTYLNKALKGFQIDSLTSTHTVSEARNELSNSFKNPYDVVFIDWNLLERDNGKIIDFIKSAYDKTVIITMISTSASSDITNKTKYQGIHHYLQKPILPSVLFNLLIRIFKEEQTKEIKAIQKIKYNWENKTILLAEDILVNQEIVKALLKSSNASIITANDGLETFQMFHQNPDQFDLILMDIQMPKLDGLSSTKKIRALGYPKAIDIPIIAMTANAFEEDIKNSLQAGMNDHLGKPIIVELLMETLNKYLKAK